MCTQGSRRIRIGAVGILVALCVALAPHLRAQSDPSLGTWKLNVAKSKYSPGPAPASETRVYEPFGAGGVKATFNRVDASGKMLTFGYSALYDGRRVPTSLRVGWMKSIRASKKWPTSTVKDTVHSTGCSLQAFRISMACPASRTRLANTSTGCRTQPEFRRASERRLSPQFNNMEDALSSNRDPEIRD